MSRKIHHILSRNQHSESLMLVCLQQKVKKAPIYPIKKFMFQTSIILVSCQCNRSIPCSWFCFSNNSKMHHLKLYRYFMGTCWRAQTCWVTPSNIYIYNTNRVSEKRRSWGKFLKQLWTWFTISADIDTYRTGHNWNGGDKYDTDLRIADMDGLLWLGRYWTIRIRDT